MTDQLYLRDSYLHEFDARVTAVQEHAVALDRTAFFPGGGGQPADAGTLDWNGAPAPVVELRRDGDLVWHVFDGAPPSADTPVRGRVDWARRYAIMRHHSALHVLVGIVYRRFGAKVTGGAIYPDRARMDFSLDNLNKELVAAIEAQTNAVIAENRPIHVRFVSREEFDRGDLTRLANVSLPRPSSRCASWRSKASTRRPTEAPTWRARARSARSRSPKRKTKARPIAGWRSRCAAVPARRRGSAAPEAA